MAIWGFGSGSRWTTGVLNMHASRDQNLTRLGSVFAASGTSELHVAEIRSDVAAGASV